MIQFLRIHGAWFVAFLALIQPWLIGLYKRYFRKGEIEIYTSGNIEVGYSLFGPTVGLNGTLRCRNQDLFVSSMNLEIMCVKDQAKHLFDWGVFKSQRITHKGEELEAELPYGLLLNSSYPQRYNITFVDFNTRKEMQDIVLKIKEAWLAIIKDQMQKGLFDESSIPKIYEEFFSTEVHVNAHTELGRLCYWADTEYILYLKIHTPKRTFEKKWKFTLNKKDIESVRLNTLQILREVCAVQSYWRYNFAYADYKEVESTQS